MCVFPILLVPFLGFSAWSYIDRPFSSSRWARSNFGILPVWHPAKRFMDKAGAAFIPDKHVNSAILINDFSGLISLQIEGMEIRLIDENGFDMKRFFAEANLLYVVDEAGNVDAYSIPENEIDLRVSELERFRDAGNSIVFSEFILGNK